MSFLMDKWDLDNSHQRLLHRTHEMRQPDIMSLEAQAASYEGIFPDLRVSSSFHKKHRVGGAN